MRSRACALVAVAAAVGALAAACDSLECGAGTHEERGACVAKVDYCLCGPGTVMVPTDAGCHCELTPPTCGQNTTWDADAGVCRLVTPAAGA